MNYEDLLQHHLYFGTGPGAPGSVLTVFPDPTGDPGRIGKPGFESVAFAIPSGSLEFWRERLVDRYGSRGGHDSVTDFVADERFGDVGIRTRDPSGTRVELVASAGPGDPWTSGPIPEGAAIRGLFGVTALPTDPYGAASVLETLGFEYEAENGDRIRYRAAGDRATVVDLLDREAPYGREGPGTVHHVAVRVPDRAALLDWHRLFSDRGYDVSRVKDRHFFHSLYVRGPGGLLIELATEAPPSDGHAGPGVVDPDVEGDATDLYLPGRFAEDRELIESQLPSIEAPNWGTGNRDRGRDVEHPNRGRDVEHPNRGRDVEKPDRCRDGYHEPDGDR